MGKGLGEMASGRFRRVVLNISRGIAVAVVLAIAGYSLYMLVGGQQVTSVQEVAEGYEGPLPVESVYRVPYPLALLYLVAAVPLLIGLIKPELMYFSWVGLVFLFLVSVMLLFSSGAAVMPAAVLVAIILAIIQLVNGSEADKRIRS